jgi:isorenieratene synthase
MMRLSKELLPQPGGERERAPAGRRAVVVGGGIAGVAAATVLAERGVNVVVVEREDHLGGRAGAWTDELADGQPFEMERGFHAFFRQYYNLRSLLRRVDPNLEVLVPTEDYPILGPGGLEETFTNLPSLPPFNVIALTKRTPHLGWRDLMKVNAKAALAMLAFDPAQTYARFDDRSAKSYLDSLRFPPKARAMLFNVFAHSFFNPEEDYSAAELLMMFHFYFMGNPEGLVFDVANRPFSTAIWKPFERYLESLGVELRLGEAATSVRRSGDDWSVETSEACHKAHDVVLALTVPALKSVVAASPELAADIGWRRQVDSLELTNPFAVLRLWIDRPAIEGRAPFVGTTGVGILDNISIFELLEDESAEWSKKTGGSVVELHAYAIDVDYVESEIREQLLDGFYELYPEYRGARILEERMLIRRDCPAFAPGSQKLRPTVETPHRGIKLAGDFIRIPIPSALMERATASGFLAANQLLGAHGVRPEPIETVPRRGLLTRPRLRRCA